jgi:hypothetical protein
MYAWTPHGSFLFDSPPKSMSKGARFWGFLLSKVRGVLGKISSISLVLASFGGPNLGYGVPMRCSYYPQSLVQNRGANQEIGSWIWRSWPVGCYSSRAAQVWPVWPVQAFCGSCLGWTSWWVPCCRVLLMVSSWQVSRSLARFCVGFSSLAGCVFWCGFVPRPKKSLRLPGTFSVQLL